MSFNDVSKDYCYEISDVKSELSEDMSLFRKSLLSRYLMRRTNNKHINLIEKDDFVVDEKLMKMVNVAMMFEIIVSIMFLVLSINDIMFIIVNLLLLSTVIYFELRTKKILKYIKIS